VKNPLMLHSRINTFANLAINVCDIVKNIQIKRA
jgi:hypothetical protein